MSHLSPVDKPCWATVPSQLHLYGSAGKLADFDKPSSVCILATVTKSITQYTWHYFQSISESQKKKISFCYSHDFLVKL